MMDWILAIGALFWLPLVLWSALFLWARFFAYPIALKRKIRLGKTWCYVPEWWSKKPLSRLCVRGVLGFLYLASAFSVAAMLYSAILFPAYLLAFPFLLCLIVEKPLVDFAMNRVYRLEVNAYFWEYKKQDALYRKSGRMLSEDDLAGRSAWAFRKALVKADSEKRLFKLLKEMAKQELAMEKEISAYENA